MKIAVANDHAGVELKKKLVALIGDLGHEVEDLGTDGTASVNYAVYGEKAARAVAAGAADYAVVICGTGIGISIAANKVDGIRAANCTNTTMAYLTRRHNDANVLAIGARIVGEELAKDIVCTFLSTDFEGGRHEERVAYLKEIEAGSVP